MGAPNGLNPSFRHPKVCNLASGNELLHRAGDLLHRHVGVHTVLVEQVDALHAQPAQGVLDGCLDVLRPAVQPGGATVVEGEPELGGDDNLLTHWSQGLADKLFVAERAVDLSSVEEGDAEIDGRTDDGDAVLLADGRTVSVAESHAAKSDRRHL